MKLENLAPATGATKTSKRLGRGQGSGKGGTATRGTKGAQARAGYEHKIGFEGGQMPIQRRLPKFGFIRVFPVKPITKKPLDTRMGKGKGDPYAFVAPITPGRIIFEAEGVSLETAKEAMRLGANKLPIATKFVVRRDYVE